MEKLTLEEISLLKLAVDNMASDKLTDSGIAKLSALYNKLDVIAEQSFQQSVQRTADGLCPNCHEPRAAHVGVHRLCPNGAWNNYGRDTRRR